MNRLLVAILLALTLGPVAPSAEAAGERIVHKGPGHRTRIVIHKGFPLRRQLPEVYIRSPRVSIRVTPNHFLPVVVFGGGTVSSLPPNEPRAWRESETLTHEDDWTEFTMNVDARGSRLLLDITEGPAQISFAEVVFQNGEAQVVEFNDRAQKLGIYSLLDFRDGRKVDHIRLVAKASDDVTTIGFHLL
jgi:hypothetical protein